MRLKERLSFLYEDSDRKCSQVIVSLHCGYGLQKVYHTRQVGSRKAKYFLGLTPPKAKKIFHLAYGSFVLSSPQSNLRFMFFCVSQK